MEWIVSKDSVLYCQITPTLPTFCLHTSASAILDGQLWSHWLQDCHFYLLCHAQSPIVSSFFSLNWKFCRLSPFMTERLGFADVFCNLLACLSNNNLRYKAKLFDLYKRMGLWGKKTFKYTTTLVFWLRMAFFVFPVSSCLVLDDLWGALFKVSYITGSLTFSGTLNIGCDGAPAPAVEAPLTLQNISSRKWNSIFFSICLQPYNFAVSPFAIASSLWI